jgi:hypothetical protein
LADRGAKALPPFRLGPEKRICPAPAQIVANQFDNDSAINYPSTVAEGRGWKKELPRLSAGKVRLIAGAIRKREA